jgi:hypothetical protein
MTRLSWRTLNEKLNTLTEAELMELLVDEVAFHKRVSMLERMHQRYSILRTARERADLLKQAVRQ